MKTLVRLLCLLIPVLLLGACHVVSTPRPLGDTPVKMAKPGWDGSWLVSDDGQDKSVMHLRVTDEAKGYAALGIVQFDGKRFSVQQISLHLRRLDTRKSGTVQLISFLDQESGRWYPGVMVLKGEQATMRPIDPTRLRELAKAGKLPALPDPPEPPSGNGSSSLMGPDFSVHADEVFTAALEKFIIQNGPDACLNPDPKSAMAFKRVARE